MKINLHIERLVLDGLPIERKDGDAVKTAVEAELARLLAEGGLGEELEAKSARSDLSGGDIHVAVWDSTNVIAGKIAGAVYGGLNYGGI